MAHTCSSKSVTSYGATARTYPTVAYDSSIDTWAGLRGHLDLGLIQIQAFVIYNHGETKGPDASHDGFAFKLGADFPTGEPGTFHVCLQLAWNHGLASRVALYVAAGMLAPATGFTDGRGGVELLAELTFPIFTKMALNVGASTFLSRDFFAPGDGDIETFYEAYSRFQLEL